MSHDWPVHLELDRRERRAAAGRRRLMLAVRRAERSQRGEAGRDAGPVVASFDHARARGGRSG